MDLSNQSLLDTTPRWLSLTLLSSSAALMVTGIGIFFSFAGDLAISPFTLLLHLLWSLVVSAWVLNLRLKLKPDRKALLAVGVAVAVGSIWSSIQQWLGYIEIGFVNDIVWVAGSMIMDTAGGAVTYILYNLNILKK